MTKTRKPKTSLTKKPAARLLKKLIAKSTGKTGGRNSAGRITSFHRGGGAKRLQRLVDLKRNVPSTGIVERIEYDPNRSSSVALVRWIDGVNLIRRRKICEPQQSDGFSDCGKENSAYSTFNASQSFMFGSLPGYKSTVNRSLGSQIKCIAKDYAFIGGIPKKAWVKQGGFATASESPSSVLDSVPRIVVAGAKPKYFTVGKMGEDIVGKNTTLSEIQKWKTKNIDRKNAIPWTSITLSEKKPNLDQSSTMLPTQILSYALSKNKNVYSRTVLPKVPVSNNGLKDCVPVSYIVASDKLEAGSTVMNCDWSKPTRAGNDNADGLRDVVYERLDINSQVGNCIQMKDIRMGTFVHNIEIRPGQGAKLVRAAGTCAKIVKHQDSKCLIRLPSGVEKLLDADCRATVGVVSNPDHGMQKLRKAGQKRWLGRRPVVRGVAMNPIDHPHGGGEGRTSGGRPSVTPWGKPTKSGYKTVLKVKTVLKAVTRGRG